MIIFRVTIGRSFVDFATVTDKAPLSSLNFGARAQESSFDSSFTNRDESSGNAEEDVEGREGARSEKQPVPQ
ncbi:hypothetical protein MD484_g4314, partial [Candolleomyces efflorescens]